MKVDEDADDADGCMFLLVHDLIDQIDEEFGEDLQHKLRFEILGGVGHDHRKSLLQQMEKPFVLVSLPEVDWQPVGDLFIVGGEIPGLLDESLDGNVVEVGLSVFDESGSGDFGDLEAKAELIFEVALFGVEADKLTPGYIFFILKDLKLLEGGLFVAEGWPKRQLASVLAEVAFEGVGFFHSLLDLHLNFSLVY